MKTAEISVKIADMPQFKALAGGIADALDRLAALTPDEADALPPSVRAAVDALAAACDGTYASPARDLPLQGHIVIEWPEPDPQLKVRPLIGWKCSLFNADTGKQFYTCRKIEVHADVEHFITADLTMFADEDGKPVFDGGPVPAPEGSDGPAFLEGTFRFLVAEMRTRQP